MKHRRLLCTTCGKQRRIRNGELVPCDHSPEDMKGIDWAAFKAARIAEAQRCE